MQRQYVVVLFPSLTDVEDEDDGVEFYWRDEVACEGTPSHLQRIS